jgi:hypothetical protein
VNEGHPDTRKDQLLYRALADFSDACDIPDLTPTCPFYQLQADDSPICGEECKDILSDDLSPSAMPQALTLGGDLVALRGRRPRPRRGPPEDLAAFDARQIYLSERDREVSTWGLTSLVNGLKHQYAWMKQDDSDPHNIRRANAIAEELERRGVNPAVVVRHGLFRHITSAVIWHIRNALPNGGDELGWIDLVRQAADNFDDLAANADAELGNIVDSVYPYLRAWIYSAPLEDLLEHRVTFSAKDLTAMSAELPDRDLDAVWLVDRFTTTYIEAWNLRSLQREWRYIHSQFPGPCPPANMRERHVPLNTLALRLAEIGVRRLETEDMEAVGASQGLLRIDQFFPLAVEALKRGERAEAESIYRMLLKVRPDDREVANNLGFCVIPEHPAESVSLFETAIENSEPGLLLAMTYLNLALAHYQLGNVTEARKALIGAREHPLEGFSGYMWDLDRLSEGPWTAAEIDGDLAEYADKLEDMLDSSS